MPVSDDSLLASLHDHYERSFNHIREREKARDRLFLITAAVLGALFLYRDHPENVMSAIKAIVGIGEEGGRVSFPEPVITSVLWLLGLFVTLRQMQASITIDRQYSYLHKLENKLSSLSKMNDVFCREGNAYAENYPVFSWWVWFVYQIVLPVLLIITSSNLILNEYAALSLPLGHLVFDSIVFCALIISVILRLWRSMLAVIRKNE